MSNTTTVTALQVLNELHIQDARERYPNLPLYALPKPRYSDKTANELTKAILAFIRFKKGYAVRINTTGSFRQNIGMNGTWTFGTTRKGTSDVHSIINGFHVSIEVKIGKDRQSAAQKATEANVKSAGGHYWLVDTFQAFYDKYIELTGGGYA